MLVRDYEMIYVCRINYVALLFGYDYVLARS